MTMSGSIRGSNGCIELVISEAPDEPVVITAGASLNSFAGAGEIVVLQSDWQRFREQLDVISIDLTGRAELNDLAGAGHLSVDMQNGGLKVRIRLTSHDGEQALVGALFSDQSYLVHFIRDLNG
jgi:hypothetical protein